LISNNSIPFECRYIWFSSPRPQPSTGVNSYAWRYRCRRVGAGTAGISTTTLAAVVVATAAETHGCCCCARCLLPWLPSAAPADVSGPPPSALRHRRLDQDEQIQLSKAWYRRARPARDTLSTPTRNRSTAGRLSLFIIVDRFTRGSMRKHDWLGEAAIANPATLSSHSDAPSNGSPSDR
jgi:hypothetical protein